MTIELTEMPEEPILKIVVQHPFDSEKDLSDTLDAVAAFQRKMGSHVYRIVDLTNFNLTFPELMGAMAFDRNKDGGINDPQVSTIYVGSGEWVEFGVTALKEQDQYGDTNVIGLCGSVDEALAVAREDLAKRV